MTTNEQEFARLFARKEALRSAEKIAVFGVILSLSLAAMILLVVFQ